MAKKDPNEGWVTTAIQNLLYSHPLYHWAPNEDEQIHVVAVGFDFYVEKFLDLCLQAGQMVRRAPDGSVADRCPRITVAASDPAGARETYLAQRPALCQFVRVNGVLDTKEYLPYAELDFIPLPYAQDLKQMSSRDDLPAVDALMQAVTQKGAVHYLFLSLGDDRLNQELAGLFAKSKPRCGICYAMADPAAGVESPAHTIPVFMNADPALDLDRSELKRIAFNIHLTWRGIDNLDFRAEREDFLSQKDSYNYESSMSYALSIPYKLYGFGLLREEDRGWMAAAERLHQLLTQQADTQEGRQIVQRLAALEHRRWVLEKITSGWQAPPRAADGNDYAYCISLGQVRDDKLKYHPCIVHSRPDTPLQDGRSSQDWRTAWDEVNEDAERDYDELDRISLALHRMFREETKKLRGSDPMENGTPATIQKLLSRPMFSDAQLAQNSDLREDKVVLEFRRFCLCLRNLLEWDAGYARQYSAYEARFSAAIDQADHLNQNQRSMIKAYLAKIPGEFFPAVESSLYRDYKQLDADLVEKIPFILTYRPPRNLGIALDLAPERGGISDAVFHNVASASVLYPERVTFLYCFGIHSDPFLLKRKLAALHKYFRGRNLHCELNLCVALLENPVQSAAGAEQCKKQAVQIEAIRKRLNSALKKLYKSGILQYKFLSCADEVDAVEKLTAYLQETHVEFFDGVNTMFSSPRYNALFVRSVMEAIPYFEFDCLEQRFLHTSRCQQLSFRRCNASIRIEDMFALMGAEDFRYHYPDYADEYLALWDIYTGKDELVSLPYTDAVGCWNYLSGQLENYGDSRVVKNLTITENRYYKLEDQKKILTALSQQSFLVDLTFSGAHGECVAFRYSSDKIRELMTKSGMILEVYTYFDACRLGYFDDVAYSYNFRWEDGVVDNELDCVLTKGFRSIIVECKAQGELNQEFFYKLDSLSSRFGVGTKKVLVATTHFTGLRVTRRNKKQVDRGRLMDIYTVCGQEPVSSVGTMLVKIMEEE